MHVKDLITDNALRLELAIPSTQTDLDRPITGVVTTESISPAAYLQPGTLLLTTGMALNFQDARIWNAYVERLVVRDVCALAFGVGLPHAEVPLGLATAALQWHLPILLVPEDVPFLQLQQTVAQVLADERFRLTRRAWELAEMCTRYASTSDDVTALLNLLHQKTQIHLDILDDTGAVFVSGPATQDHDRELTALDLPLPIGNDATWSLRARVASLPDSQSLLSPATTVISMLLSRSLSNPAPSDADRLATMFSNLATGRSELLQELSAEGFETLEGARVLSVNTPSLLRTRLLSRRIASLLGRGFHTTTVVINGQVNILAAPLRLHSDSTGTVSPKLPEEAEFQANISAEAGDGLLISEPAASVEQLALTVAFQSRRAPRPGLDYGGPPDLDAITRLIPETPRAALVDAVLGPVLQGTNAEQRLDALKAIIATGTNSAAAARLGVHRNTLYTLRGRLEDQLALDLEDPSQRAVISLALTILETSYPMTERPIQNGTSDRG